MEAHQVIVQIFHREPEGNIVSETTLADLDGNSENEEVFRIGIENREKQVLHLRPHTAFPNHFLLEYTGVGSLVLHPTGATNTFRIEIRGTGAR